MENAEKDQEHLNLIMAILTDGIYNGLVTTTPILSDNPEEMIKSGIVSGIGLMMSQTGLDKALKRCRTCQKKLCDKCNEPQSNIMTMAIALSSMPKELQEQVAVEAKIENEKKEYAKQFNDVEKFF